MERANYVKNRLRRQPRGGNLRWAADIQVPSAVFERYSGKEKTAGMSAQERPYITCRELLDFLYLYLENELPEDRRGEFDRHLAVCEPCRAYIRQYEETIRLGRSAVADPGAPSAADAPEELVQAVLKARRK
jgi:hypothetical protein